MHQVIELTTVIAATFVAQFAKQIAKWILSYSQSRSLSAPKITISTKDGRHLEISLSELTSENAKKILQEVMSPKSKKID
jgi:hypothetical protein